MSPPEVLLWSRLKLMRAQGFHFRRQAPFRGYYLDFVCFGRRLVVEVDGGQHAEDAQAAHDAVRDAVLRREGFEVMRFWAGTVLSDVGGVVDAITDALARAPAQRTPP
jgi:very-short-patch-repair endonuclease